MPIRLSGQLPEGTANGLAPAIEALIRQPRRTHLVIALVDAAKITTNADTGDVVPTMRIRAIEVVRARDMRAVERLMRGTARDRTGLVELPFELEEALGATSTETSHGLTDMSTAEER